MLTVVEGAVSAGFVLVIALWMSSSIERWLLKGAHGSQLSWRMAASNAVRAALIFVGLLVALSAVGIDLTALSVLGGAIGVGVGFGLQKLASNYVSGFVILAERALRIGDTVKVDGFEGTITDIATRYTVLKAPDGRESIVPNEMFITQRVESTSLSSPRLVAKTVVRVAYGTDVETLLPAIVEAVARVPRVIEEPKPGAGITAFGTDGLEITVTFWISDPQNGTGGPGAEVNLELLRLFKRLGVEIPYPQRVVRTLVEETAPPLAGAAPSAQDQAS